MSNDNNKPLAGGQSLYDMVLSALSNSFETAKGFGSDCPFCFSESTSGKIRFMVFADHEAQEITGFNCFVCNRKGAGASVRVLYRELGLNIFALGLLGSKPKKSLFASESGGDNEASSTLDSMFGGKKRKEKVAEIQWPPHWVQVDDDLYEKAVAYMAKRGVLNAERFIKKHDLAVSLVIDRSSGDDRSFVSYFPSIIAPAVDIDGQIVGWSARRIDGLSTESRHDAETKLYRETKTYSMPGDEWKKRSLFGFRELDPDYPVTIVEGFFDALATPNGVALLGKRLSADHAKMLGFLKAETYIIAVDPDVKARDQSNLMTSVMLSAPNAAILPIDLSGEAHPDLDPGDRGRAEMARLIKKTVLSSTTDK